MVYFPADRVVSVGDLLTTSDQIPGIVMYADGVERVPAMNRERKPQEEITQTPVKEFNWGSGLSPAISGMMQEFR